MTLEEKLKALVVKYNISNDSAYLDCTMDIIDDILSICQQEIDEACKEQIKLKDLIFIYNSGYLKGHHDTVESGYADLRSSELDNYHYEEVTELMEENSIKLPPSPKENIDNTQREMLSLMLNAEKRKLKEK